MNGMRWTTGIGIALGGTGGAIAALMGAPAPAPAPAPSASAQVAAPPAAAQLRVTGAASATPAPPTPAPSAAASTVAVASASAAPPPAAPALSLPTTREGLLKAELYCDQKKDFDECTRAALALEAGTTGPADPEQAKRFRRIALTHLVTQCEAGSPRACFVLAAKYRAGTEMAKSTSGADELERHARDLCRSRPAPGCPTP